MSEKKPLSEQAKEIAKNFDQQKKEVDSEVRRLSSFMTDTVKLANNKHEIYRYRQEVNAMRLEVMTLSNSWNRKAIKAKSDIYIAYKLGKKQIAPGASIAENHQLKPKNDFERNLYLDSDMRTMNYVLQMIENQLEFLKDALSNITNMAYGIDYIIKLEEYKIR